MDQEGDLEGDVRVGGRNNPWQMKRDIKIATVQSYPIEENIKSNVPSP